MNKWLKIFLWIFGVLLLILVVLGIYAYYSYKQIVAVASIASDENFKQNAIALVNGDCSKYSDVQLKYEEIKNTIRSACANLGVRVLMEKEIQKYKEQAVQNEANVSDLDVCAEIDNPNSVYLKYLEKARNDCNLTA